MPISYEDIVVVDRSLELKRSDQLRYLASMGEFNIKFVEISEEGLFLGLFQPEVFQDACGSE